MAVLTDLKNRGTKDVFFVVCDGLKGLPEVVENAWPQAIVQTCIVHRSRKKTICCFQMACRCSGMGFSEDVLSQLALRLEVVLPHLNERQRRLVLGQEARLLGHGGVRVVAAVAGVSETTVRAGCSSWRLARTRFPVVVSGGPAVAAS
jgi:hypothetical protein